MTALRQADPGRRAMQHRQLAAWVEDVCRLTQPDAVHWCAGSDAENEQLLQLMVGNGELIRLNPQRHPNSYYFRSDVNDVARVESRTFICSRRKEDAGPTNLWVDPEQMKETLTELFRGSMRGRTLYVVPYLMGPPGSPMAKVGVELTDSPYVVLSMRIMTRMGSVAMEALGESGEFSRGLHGMGQLDPNVRYISHFPEENLVMSFSSNYGGNALLGKKCFALRLASVLARREGWLAEHMLILGLTDPQGRKTYVAAAFPSACGKTNLAMLVPPPEFLAAGWRVETIGDDIAWLKFGPDGRLYAVNPEAGFFGVAPGTSDRTNPNAMAACRSNTIFTNVALCDDGTVWWEGMGPAPAVCTDWRGQPWTPASGRPAAHPNSRFTAPAAQCPSISPDWDNPQGVPISAIIFGGRRSTTVPLAFEAFDWQHGTYLGATMSSEKTAAAAGDVGELRHDPMAMLPFCGYHMGDYWRHWLEVGRRGGEKMPRVFHVNWFRKDSAGRFLWPGFGTNMHVLQWIVSRCWNEADAVESPIGLLPAANAINFAAAQVPPEAAAELFAVHEDEWRADGYERAIYFRKFGDRLPPELQLENDALLARLDGESISVPRSL